MKILFITVWYPTQQQPLMGTFIRAYASAVQCYDEVAVLHCGLLNAGSRGVWSLEKEPDEQLTQGICTYRGQYRPLPIPFLSYPLYLWSVLQSFRRIVSQGFCPDIIHAQVYEAGVPAVLLGKLYRIPVVISEHFSAFLSGALSRKESVKARFAFQAAAQVLPVSRALQSAIEGYQIQSHFSVVPNVIDTTLFTPADQPCAEHAIKRLLFVGAFIPRKGLPYLLRALAQLQQRDDWVLEIVGDGPERAAYERLVHELGMRARVIFHGRKPQSEVAALMRQVDLFVLPSLFETFSVAAAEAIASGIPVLATRCGGPEDFVTDTVGLLVAPADVDALYQGLCDILPRLRQFSSQELAHYAVERFSTERIGEQLHRLYRRSVEGVRDG